MLIACRVVQRGMSAAFVLQSALIGVDSSEKSDRPTSIMCVQMQPSQPSQPQAQPPAGTMYVRVKRKKATYFIHIEPSDTVANLKLEIAKLTQQVVTSL